MQSAGGGGCFDGGSEWTEVKTAEPDKKGEEFRELQAAKWGSEFSILRKNEDRLQKILGGKPGE